MVTLTKKMQQLMVNQPNTLSLSCPAFTPLPQFPTLSLTQNYFNNFTEISRPLLLLHHPDFGELSLSLLSVLSFFSPCHIQFLFRF